MASPPNGGGALAREPKAEIVKVIDESLGELLGEPCLRAIYYYFQLRTGLRPEDVADRPEAFVAFLREMFRAGAQVVERRIAERLCARFGVDVRDVGDLDLVNLIKALTSKR